MASLRRKPNSRFWIACFTDPNGVQRQVSTKELNRAKAQRIADKFEATYRLKLTEAQARKVISDIYEEIRGDKLLHSTVRAFLAAWLDLKKAEVASGSYKRYANAVGKLIAFLGNRADDDIAYVDKRDIVALRDRTAGDLSVSTANTDLKIFRIAFAHAVADGLRPDNPAKAVKTLKDYHEPDEPRRRCFTTEELKRLLEVLTGEWRGITLMGLYTGQRLGDIASLQWSMIDLDQRIITFRTRKTGRIVTIPIADPLFAWLTRARTFATVGSVFPSAGKARVEADGESRRLSAQFHVWLVTAGLAEKRSKRNTGRGHSVKRTVSELSFHCLRHTLNSWLKRAGVAESVVRDIIGHDSELVSRVYTHIDDDSKRRAVASMPVL